MHPAGRLSQGRRRTLIDATIIRAILLPASMRLLGDWNWYLPKSLQWLPKFHHEPAPQPAFEVAGD